MSGPKVINIEAVRRRQKRESIAYLKQLELAIAECERWQAQPRSSELLKRLHSLREAEQWDVLSVEAEKQKSFFQAEARQLQERHAAAKAADLLRSHRVAQSVAQMHVILNAQPASSERDTLIRRLSEDHGSNQQEALEAAENFLAANNRAEMSPRLAEIATAYVDINLKSERKILPHAHADPREARMEKCWHLLGELSTEDDSNECEALFEQARRLSGDGSDQQAMLLDTLVLEISTHLQSRRAKKAFRSELEILRAELEEIHTSEAAEWIQRIDDGLEPSASVKTMQEIALETRTWIDQTFEKETRDEQRLAVLQALAGVGYEIREGMATAWVQDGRILVRKPNEASYGVELSAPARGNAIQTRVVALTDSPRDSRRDNEIEESWCGEFKQIRLELDEQGFNTQLVRAQPVGTIPLKVVDITSSDRRREAETRPVVRRTTEN